MTLMQTRTRPILPLVGILLAAGAVRAARLEYVQKPDPAFRKTAQTTSAIGDVKIINLRFTSQVWRGIPWEHALQVFVPKTVRYPKTALLFITGGNPGVLDTSIGVNVAPKLEAPIAILYNIPNQPLFDGKREDDLIAHTFQEYLTSGDETWPLLFPMTKSALRAMDVLQDLSKA